eukprot:295125-Pelagomonas_calceolata.AAC.7
MNFVLHTMLELAAEYSSPRTAFAKSLRASAFGAHASIRRCAQPCPTHTPTHAWPQALTSFPPDHP